MSIVWPIISVATAHKVSSVLAVLFKHYQGIPSHDYLRQAGTIRISHYTDPQWVFAKDADADAMEGIDSTIIVSDTMSNAF